MDVCKLFDNSTKRCFGLGSKYYDAVKPVIEECYQHVVDGIETTNVINANQDNNYREKLEKELELMKNQEIWEAFRSLRSLRPDEQEKSNNI